MCDAAAQDRGAKCRRCARVDVEVNRQVGKVSWLRDLPLEQQRRFYLAARELATKDMSNGRVFIALSSALALIFYTVLTVLRLRTCG